MTKQQAKPLHRPLLARINRLAHSHALQHETRLRASLLARVHAARDGGATLDELVMLVDTMEAGWPSVSAA